MWIWLAFEPYVIARVDCTSILTYNNNRGCYRLHDQLAVFSYSVVLDRDMANLRAKHAFPLWDSETFSVIHLDAENITHPFFHSLTASSFL